MPKDRWTTADIRDQTGRVVIVTGANSGIGYETAEALAAAGAEVVVASRNEERGLAAVERIRAKAPGATVDLIRLDLASLDSVHRFADKFREGHERLDLLINNAGVMNPPERRETEEGFELQFGTNHLGHFALTMRLIGDVVATPGSRVVTVASTAQRLGKPDFDDLDWTKRRYVGMRAYGASKTANMLFTLELQRRLTDARASTIAVAAHPGWTATNLQDETPIARMANPLFAMKPWKGALPTLYAAVADRVEPGGYYGPDGFFSWWGYPTANRPAPHSTDADMAARLWEVSEDLTGAIWPEVAPN